MNEKKVEKQARLAVLVFAIFHFAGSHKHDLLCVVGRIADRYLP